MDQPLVLLTGASGYIASHCLGLLLEQNYRVRGTVRSLKNADKIDFLKAIAKSRNKEDMLELVEADLLGSAESWQQAVDGCCFVMHTASPFLTSDKVSDPQRELIEPAVQGTTSVLNAVANTHGSVKRVVLTASCATIFEGHANDRAQDYIFTEEDHTNLNGPRVDDYSRSKTLAEQAAWDLKNGLSEQDQFELVTIHPCFVQGPFYQNTAATSAMVLGRMLSRADPACLPLGFPMVDVRDVALTHVKALSVPEAANQRFICASEFLWLQEMATILAAELNPKGYNIVTGLMPTFVAWFLKFFIKELNAVYPRLNQTLYVSSEKAQKTLGVKFRPVKETIIEQAYSQIAVGSVTNKLPADYTIHHFDQFFK